jgi:hypothetical protein
MSVDNERDPNEAIDPPDNSEVASKILIPTPKRKTPRLIPPDNSGGN